VRFSGSSAEPEQFAPRRDHLGEILVCREGERHVESVGIGSTPTAPPVSTTIGYLTAVRFEHEAERQSGQVGHGATSSTESKTRVYLDRYISQGFIFALVPIL
jgi:hypothetical protein